MIYLTTILCALVLPLLVCLVLWWRGINWRHPAYLAVLLGNVVFVALGRLADLKSLGRWLDFMFNRLEHACLLACVVLGILVLFRRWALRQEGLALVLIAIGLAAIPGLIIEFLQVLPRLHAKAGGLRMSWWYLDSLFDLAADLAGGVVAGLLVQWSKKPRPVVKHLALDVPGRGLGSAGDGQVGLIGQKLHG